MNDNENECKSNEPRLATINLESCQLEIRKAEKNENFSVFWMLVRSRKKCLGWLKEGRKERRRRRRRRRRKEEEGEERREEGKGEERRR